MHFEKSQHVFFTTETALDRAINLPKTTLTEFFELFNRANAFGSFSQTLLNSLVLCFFIWAQSKKWMPRKQGTPVDAFLELFSQSKAD